MLQNSISLTKSVISTVALIAVVFSLYHFLPKVQVEFPFKEINSSVFQDPSSIAFNRVEAIVEKGDTLIKILGAHGVDSKGAKIISQKLNDLEERFVLNVGDKISIGEVKEVSIDEKNQLFLPLDLELIKGGQIYDLAFDEAENSYTAKTCNVPLETYTKFVSGKVQGSIFSAARIKGVDVNTVMSFINLYSFIVDFQRDIKSGDDFKIYYEYQVDPSNGKIKNTNILYAALNTGGQNKEIYRHEMSDGKVDYFDSNGYSVKRALLKTPVNGARISGRYGWRKKHPVLGYSRMHKGVDYAAPTGTPIFASGDGVVSFAKNQRRGYGRHLQIRHNSTYSTLYAHLSKFAKGIKSGTRVAQGQIIGYIGSTGLASGPHLHYEVKVRGKQVNPAKIDYIKTKPLQLAELDRFKKNVALYDVIVENAQSTTMVAKVN